VCALLQCCGINAIRVVTGYEEFAEFMSGCLIGHRLDGYRTLRLFTGLFKVQDGGGSAVPLTPILPNGEVFAMTANHCVHGKASIQATPEIDASWRHVDGVRVLSLCT